MPMRPMRILRCLRGTWRGADPKTLLMLYKSLVRSKIKYCGYLISPCKESYFEKLQKIQNKFFRIVMGYRNSTPINVIHAETKVQYLEFRFKHLGYKFVLKSLSYLENKLILKLESLSNLADNLVYENNNQKSMLLKFYEDSWFSDGIIIKLKLYYKYTISFNDYLTNINVDLASGKKLKVQNMQAFNNKFKNENRIHIYTDGSKMTENDKSFVGFAVWSENPAYVESNKISDFASIYTAECLALIHTCNLIIKNEDSLFRIFTDSKSALKSLLNRSKSNNESPLIIQLKDKLAKIKNIGKNVIFTWDSITHRNSR